MIRAPRLVRLLLRVGDLCLLLYPRPFRRRYGAEMRATLRDLFLDAARRGGGPAALRTAAFHIRRMAGNGLAERFAPDPRPEARSMSPTSSRSVPSARGALSGLGHDLLGGLRKLHQRPGYSLLVVVLLALGIGANTAIFSIFNGLFLDPLPFPEADRLIDLDETAPAWNLEFVGVSYPDFHAWQEGNRTFEAMAAMDQRSYNMATAEGAERITAAVVSHTMDEVLGLRPTLGRTFDADDDREGAAATALVTHGAWQRRFGGDPQVVGRAIRLDGVEHTVVGVLPPEAMLPPDVDLWVPLSSLPRCCDPDAGWGTYWLRAVGRLRPDATLEQAREDLAAVHAGLAEDHPSRKEATPRLTPLVERLFGDMRPSVLILLGAVGVLLLIACANVAGLMLARSATRNREMGIRRALGAGRLRLARQMLMEGLVLAVLGGAAGVALGHLGLQGMLSLLPDEGGITWVSFGMDGDFLLFTLALVAGSTLLFGLVPAVQASRRPPTDSLHEGDGRASGGRGRRRLLGGFVVGELALAVCLLVAAGLLLQALRTLHDVEPGFRTDVLTVSYALPDATYPEAEDRQRFHQRFLERVSGVDAVEAAGLVSLPPLSGHSGWFFEVEGRPEEEHTPVTLMRLTGPGYFEAMGVTLLAGRAFTEADLAAESRPVVIVNQSFAEHYWPGGDPLGERIRTGGDDEEWLTVVGITRDVRHYGPATPMRPGVYLPYRTSLSSPSSMSLALRGEEPTALLAPAREIARELDPEVPLFAVDTMEERLSQSLWQQRAASTLVAIFAGIALVLALAGIYGTVSYAVNQRRRELGIRIALGARDRQVLGVVLREGMLLATLGAALGLGLAALLAAVLSSALEAVEPWDPVVYAAVVALLGAAALVANWLPARRAAATDPVDALKAD